MIGDLFLYAANRATSGAVEGVARKASWGGFAIFMLLSGTVFGLFVCFWMLEAMYGAPMAGGIIAAACFAVGLVCLMMPKLLDWSERKSTPVATPSAQTVASVQAEVGEAVDYFGPIRVLATAFMLGFGIAKRIKN